MGRKLNSSQPLVINTQLVPMVENLTIEQSGVIEQWYYMNENRYAPDRSVTPLVLTPVVSAYDKDSFITYASNSEDESTLLHISSTAWYENGTEITNLEDTTNADYVKTSGGLIVKKNVAYNNATTISCIVTYIDPRDSGISYQIEGSVLLTTSRDATVVFPEIAITSPSSRAYNPLVDDDNSEFDFTAAITNSPIIEAATKIKKYKANIYGTEEIVQSSANENSSVAPILDIRYGENDAVTDQEFMFRQTANGAKPSITDNNAYIERVKGNTVAWNQLVQNGNFSNGTTGWFVGNDVASFSVSNGYAILKIESTAQNRDLRYRGVTPVVGHKYYVSFFCMTTKDVLIQTYLSTPNHATENVVNFSTSSTNKFLHFSALNEVQDTTQIELNITIKRGYSVKDFLFYLKDINLIDLTLIYGAGNEPSTAAEFEADYLKWFGKPLSYEDYDAGSLKSVKMSGIKTTGQNQWDEEWEEGYISATTGENYDSNMGIRSKNFIKVLPSTDYYLYSGMQARIFQYDSNKKFLGSTVESSSKPFQTDSNSAYIRFQRGNIEYNNDICINISDTDINGTYKAYSGKKANFNVTKLKGRLNGSGSSVYVFPDGMKSAGSVYDEIKVENGVLKAIKRIGSVDLGTLYWIPWINQSTGSYRMVSEDLSAVLYSVTSNEKANILCSKYCTRTANETFFENNGISSSSSTVHVYDAAYNELSSTTSFKTAISGVYLYYELAEPQEYIIDNAFDFGFKWYGISNGEEVLAETLPWYVEGQDTDTLTVDAMFGDDINVVLRAKREDTEALSPSKAYSSIQWRIPDVETTVTCDNGSAVRSSTGNMLFKTIVNVKGDVLSDTLKDKHLRFNWKYRKSNLSTETDAGWGLTKTISGSSLRNVIGSANTPASTLVYPYVYVLGPWQVASGTSADYGKPTTTKGGVTYERTID